MGGEELKCVSSLEHLYVSSLTCQGEKRNYRDPNFIWTQTRRYYVRGVTSMVGNLERVHLSALVNQRLKLIHWADKIKLSRAKWGTRGYSKLFNTLLWRTERCRPKWSYATVRSSHDHWIRCTLTIRIRKHWNQKGIFFAYTFSWHRPKKNRLIR